MPRGAPTVELHSGTRQRICRRPFVEPLPKDLPCPGRAIVGGDALEPAISAASILAKVSRDRLMVAMNEVYPGYGFAVHKGYPTPAHLASLQQLGPCAQHRRSFAPVHNILYPQALVDSNITL